MAQRKADSAEEDAEFAIEYAYWAVEEAEYAVLDASWREWTPRVWRVLAPEDMGDCELPHDGGSLTPRSENRSRSLLLSPFARRA